MNNFKEFQAKTLDQAIADACDFFKTERVKLEIDILEDAKSGIFGLVGARKARVNARLAQIPNTLISDDTKPKRASKTSDSAKTSKAKAPKVSTDSLETKLENSENISETKSAHSKVEKTEKKQKVEKTESFDSSHTAPLKAQKQVQQAIHDDDDDDESQRKFLSKMNDKIDHYEELDESVLEELDREAMEKANLLGNLTEAEIRAAGHIDNTRRPHNKLRNTSTSRRDDTRKDRTSSRESKDSRRLTERNNTSRTRKDIKSENPERSIYEQKRRQERAERPPKQIIVSEYDPVPLPRIALSELDQDMLIHATTVCIKKLVSGIVGEDAPFEIKIADDRVHVSIESEDTGLLIGREGQHLAAIQYLASRILAREIGSQIRVQVDTGDYHSRQDSRMEFLAQNLAEKAKHSGRPQSTRPLSAYQRRVIHLALQDDEEIQTRSCGEGTLKRVIIMRRRHVQTQKPHEDFENPENYDMDDTIEDHDFDTNNTNSENDKI